MARLYDKRRWKVRRRSFLQENPLCVMCSALGLISEATVVDHIRPHKDDADLFWDESNWQALCKHHHDSAKQSEEKTGKAVGCDLSGNPFREW